ncbi:MAG: hypothetical protein RL217_1180 [Pseudomonadota bacterium]|jgi:lipopolysaccharide export system protein LptA
MPRLLNKLILLCLFAPALALALPEDFDQETVIVSDSAKLDRQAGSVVYSGDVILTQGTIKINADRLTVFRGSDDRLEKVIAEGKPALYEQQIQANEAITHAKALRIEYLAKQRQTLLLGKAHLDRESNVLTGERIWYDMDKEIVSAGEKNGDKPSRIRVVIQPQQAKKP